MDPIESVQRFKSQKQKVRYQKKQKTKIKMKRGLSEEE